jgi:hypothetical protein
MPSLLGLRHTAADGFEDLCLSQSGDQQSKGIAVKRLIGANVTAGAGAPIDLPG